MSPLNRRLPPLPIRLVLLNRWDIVAIEWDRYAELFAYDDQSELFSLEDVTA